MASSFWRTSLERPTTAPIIQIGGQGAALVPPERQDVGVLAIQIAGILGIDLQLLDNVRRESRRVLAKSRASCRKST